MVANWMYEEKALNIPEGKTKVIRKALIQHFTKTKYFKFRDGTYPITPQDRNEMASICRTCGWNEPPVFDNYYEENDFYLENMNSPSRDL